MTPRNKRTLEQLREEMAQMGTALESTAITRWVQAVDDVLREAVPTEVASLDEAIRVLQGARKPHDPKPYELWSYSARCTACDTMLGGQTVGRPWGLAESCACGMPLEYRITEPAP